MQEEFEKYIEAWKYLDLKLHTALFCLDIKDEKATKALLTLKELVYKYKTEEERKIVIEAMERNSDDRV